MKTVKFSKLEIGNTFYKVGDFNHIIQYEKISDFYAIEILTNSSKWFEDLEEVMIEISAKEN